jgi:multiple sugar transport system substrate-binding protein
MTIQLKGITWGHTRGYLPMVATAQRFSEVHPEVRIQWEIRSLQQFADMSLSVLAEKYDLLVIDHPSVGHVAEGGILAPLDEWISRQFLDDQAVYSVGHSHESYWYEQHHWALAIDAATPISGWRPDLLQREKMPIPATWHDLLELARRGLVAVPGIPIDSLMHFYMFCGALGEDPFLESNVVVEESVGVKALELQRELMLLCDPVCFKMNPIAVWELLSRGDKAAYCPFAYGYSNYSREGYANNVLSTGGLVKLEAGRSFRSTLGGAGLAISATCQHKEVAAEYASFVAGEKCQRTLYFESGGQPGHLAGWTSVEVNRRCNGFFETTLATLQAAYLRPRFYGYLDFQDHGGPIVHKYLTDGGAAKETIAALNKLLRGCREKVRRSHDKTS